MNDAIEALHHISRRDFIKIPAIGGLSVSTERLHFLEIQRNPPKALGLETTKIAVTDGSKTFVENLLGNVEIPQEGTFISTDVSLLKNSPFGENSRITQMYTSAVEAAGKLEVENVLLFWRETENVNQIPGLSIDREYQVSYFAWNDKTRKITFPIKNEAGEYSTQTYSVPEGMDVVCVINSPELIEVLDGYVDTSNAKGSGYLLGLQDQNDQFAGLLMLDGTNLIFPNEVPVDHSQPTPEPTISPVTVEDQTTQGASETEAVGGVVLKDYSNSTDADILADAQNLGMQETRLDLQTRSSDGGHYEERYVLGYQIIDGKNFYVTGYIEGGSIVIESLQAGRFQKFGTSNHDEAATTLDFSGTIARPNFTVGKWIVSITGNNMINAFYGVYIP